MLAAEGYFTIVERLFEQLDLLLNNSVFNSYNALADYLKTPFGLAIILYISLLGLSITQGWIKLSMENLVKALLKLAFIYMAAMHWSFFSHYIVDSINKVAAQIGSILLSTSHATFNFFAGESINKALQSLLIEFTEIGNWTWNKGSWNNLGPFFTALLVWIFGYSLLLLAIFELVIAKVMIAILFSTAPLFISFTVFKVTHGIFDRWLGACIGFTLLTVIISMTLAFIFSLTQSVLVDLYATHASKISLMGFVPVMVVGFIGVGMLLKASHLAQIMGGTITTACGSSLLASTIGYQVVSMLSIGKIASSALKNSKFYINKKAQSNNNRMNSIRKSIIKTDKK